MRALLDINVLIALLDADHTLHGRAVQWFDENARQGWASCPITQNGCARIMSNPGYPNPLPVAAIIERLAAAAGTEYHAFWPDDVSLLTAETADPARIHGPRQLTDLYLLALAVRHSGRFVTFDGGVPLSPVIGANQGHLLVL